MTKRAPDRPVGGKSSSSPADSSMASWEDDGGSILDSPVDPGGRGTTQRSSALEAAMVVGKEIGLPPEAADRFVSTLGRFVKIEAVGGVALLVATCVAIVLSNSAWSASYLGFWETPIGIKVGRFEFGRSLQHWINDGLMTVFFFVVALELKRELVLGELRGLRRAGMPLAGAIGGIAVPVSLYVALMAGKPGLRGWGTVMATDTAFVVGCLALLGSRVPASLRLFLLSLAVFDDVGAILVVAIGYGDAIVWPAIAFAAIGLAAVYGAARVGLRSVPLYCLLGGTVWLAFDGSGIHPTVAGVILGLMTPARGWVSDARLHALFGRVLAYPEGDHWSGDTTDREHLGQAGRAARETLSPVERLEMKLHPWARFAIMPAFALANAGVPMSKAGVREPVVVAVLVGLVIGKPVGVLAASWLATRWGLASRPASLTWPLVGAGALLTGIGFTMSLFIAGLSYTPSELDAAKIGILAGSVLSAAGGMVALGWLSRPKRPA